MKGKSKDQKKSELVSKNSHIFSQIFLLHNTLNSLKTLTKNVETEQNEQINMARQLSNTVLMLIRCFIKVLFFPFSLLGTKPVTTIFTTTVKPTAVARFLKRKCTSLYF